LLNMPEFVPALTSRQPALSQRKWWVVLAASATLFSCGGPERETPGRWNGGGGEGGLGGQSNVISVGNCGDSEAEDRPCKVYHQQANGVTSCFNGIQYCDGGRWSDCIDPDNDPRVE
jgi:hypothetical protein